MMAGDVRAAERPGRAATRLATASVARAATASHVQGVSGGAAAWRPSAYRRQTVRPSTIPSGAPTSNAPTAITDACQPTDVRNCHLGEAESAQQCQLAAALTYRCEQEVGERNDHDEGQDGGHHGGNDAHPLEVADRRRRLLGADHGERALILGRRLQRSHLDVHR